MLRFFIGLVLAQLVIAALVYFSPLSNLLEQVLLIGFVILLISIVTTLWFGTVAKHLADKRIAVLKEQFASEREKINVTAERAQKKLLKSTQKEIESERRKQLTTAGGAIGGYLARTRKEQLEGPEYKMIEGVEVVDEQPKKLTDQTTEDPSRSGETIVSAEPESDRPQDKS